MELSPRALRVFHILLTQEIHRIAQAANLQDTYHAGLPHAIKASKYRKVLHEIRVEVLALLATHNKVPP